MTTGLHRINADRPLEDRAQDALRRAPFAESLARQIRSLPLGESYVLGLSGPWGSGKSTILNFVETALAADHSVVRFNPWLFGNVSELTAAFFHELATQLMKRGEALASTGKALIRYGETISELSNIPIIGGLSKVPLIGRYAEDAGKLLKLIGRLTKRAERPESVVEQKKRLVETLSKLDTRILVAIDDVDRLEGAAVRDLFRLIRLVADFPNVTYLIAIDRQRVARALSADDDGPKYLEKIFQVVYDVPVADRGELTALCTRELFGVLAAFPFLEQELAKHEWLQVCNVLVAPLLTTPRDVRRFLNAIPMALTLVGEEVALVDVLALEAVRVLYPEFFELLVANAEHLTNDEPYDPNPRGEMALMGDARFRAVSEILGDDYQKEFLRRVFPITRRYFDNQHYGQSTFDTWTRDRRVTVPPAFRIYLEKALPQGMLSSRRVERIRASIADVDALTALLAELTPHELEDCFVQVAIDRSRLEESAAAGAIACLLDESNRISMEVTNPLELGWRNQLISATMRAILDRVDEGDRTRALIAAAQTAQSLSALLIILLNGRRLYPDVESTLAEELIRAASVASSRQLAGERNLFAILLRTGISANDPRIDASVFLQVLRSSRRTAFVGERRLDLLTWRELVGFFGEARLTERIRSLDPKDHPDELSRSCIRIARGYLTGESLALEALVDEPRLEERQLLELLDSDAPARRKAAHERIRNLRASPEGLPAQIVVKLQQIANDGGSKPTDRVDAIRSLLKWGATKGVAEGLISDWLNKHPIPAEVSSMLPTLLEEHQAATSQAIEALRSVTPSGHENRPMQDLFAGVASQIEAHPDRFSDLQHSAIAEAANRLLTEPANGDLKQRVLRALRVEG